MSMSSNDGTSDDPSGSAGTEIEPTLSRERIAAAAIALLDEKGTGGLTMRGLAERLGSGVMSLYWHVRNKEDVLDLALDGVLAYAPTEYDARDWRSSVVAMVQDWRQIMLDHPWSGALLPSRALGPNMLVRLEFLSQNLKQAGVSAADTNAAVWSVWNYVMGATATRAGFGPSREDRTALQGQLAEMHDRFPGIGETQLLLDDDWDGTFLKGLNFLLDGLSPPR
jgi:AcrR family transcriptional regulator